MSNSLADVESLTILLGLPDHLRKTLLALNVHPYSTADNIATETKRARAVESSYLNQLHLIGLAKKSREGRKAIFHLENAKPQLAKTYQQLAKLPHIFRRIVCADLLSTMQERVAYMANVADKEN